ncbi:MAG TPA: hypothetical protein VNU26_02135 [Mycobacteriales bacterium]|nr:hypothetical protein [Mycobacteriales bacterium]
MSTATQNKARTTKTNAQRTASSASSTAKSAARDAKRTTRPARREARRTEQGVVRHTRRVIEAAQAEVTAVAETPYRPALFALGLLDRTVSGAKELPTYLAETPVRVRQRVIDVFATAGDLAEKAQQEYTEVAKDGSALVRAIRRQDSTQRAERFAERAATRSRRAVQDAEKALEAGTEAAGQALAKVG